jgi:hypothetical protein
MVIVICQHSGIEFEAATKRTKQHPDIASLKDRANKDGNYREVGDALDTVKKAGGYATIEEYMGLVRAELQKKRDAFLARAAKQREWQAKDEAEKAEREARRAAENELLKANGYVWRKEAIGTEDSDMRGSYGAGVGEFSHYEWRLYAADGREVSKDHALAEIKFGAEFVQAEEEAYAEDKERAAKAEAAIQSQKEQAYQTAKAEAKQLTEVEFVDYNLRKDFETVASYRLGGTVRGVSKGTINDVLVYSVWQTGDMDTYSFYCQNPEVAGLKKQEASSTDSFLGMRKRYADIFSDDSDADEDYF